MSSGTHYSEGGSDSEFEIDKLSTKEEEQRHLETPFSECEKDGLYKAIFSRRDVRTQFEDREISLEILNKILNAAHHAPSVGFSQPWNFIIIKDINIRREVKAIFEREREKSISLLNNNPARQKLYSSLKLEGIVESALNICITYDPARFGPFVLGRTSIPEAGIYSVCCAVQNLWLAARTEGIGMGWVSIIENHELRKILSIPSHVTPVAYLCAGYVKEFAKRPDLESAGWLHRLSLRDVTFYEKWGNESDNLW